VLTICVSGGGPAVFKTAYQSGQDGNGVLRSKKLNIQTEGSARTSSAGALPKNPPLGSKGGGLTSWRERSWWTLVRGLKARGVTVVEKGAYAVLGGIR